MANISFAVKIVGPKKNVQPGGETSGETGETGAKTGGETGPSLANSPTMHSRVVCKEPKSLLLNGKKKKVCHRRAILGGCHLTISLNDTSGRGCFAMAQIDTHTVGHRN